MATEDLTRSAFYRSKRYSGVRMQQGRVLTDDDFNEAQRIREEEERVARVHIIGGYGTPDGGFRIVKGTPKFQDGQIDFQVEKGNFYLSGLRVELDEPTTFRGQTDWLCNPGVEAPSAERYDLVYLEVWQQPVSAVEDAELFEAALGGPDTSTRLRTMFRVKVEPAVDPKDFPPQQQSPGTITCTAAWEVVQQSWQTKQLGKLNEENELVPDTRLVVGYEQVQSEPANLCAPALAGGYLGAENQAIRVQLVGLSQDDGSPRFTWGFDNAAPLYRVLVEPGKFEVTMLTSPKDASHWPMAGQVVEVLSCAALLSNGESLAEELEFGDRYRHLCKVQSSYEQGADRFTLAEPVPNDFATSGTPCCCFLRVWDRGADHESQPAIKLAEGQKATLGNTGLSITLRGKDYRPGDYWIIAARPETPNRVVPWELEEGRPPDGVRRFRAPLGLIHWQGSGSLTQEPDVIDEHCHKPWKPQTQCCPNGGGNGTGTGAESRPCCTVTVGGPDNKTTIQEAVNHLQSTGGEICILPGEYEETVHIHKANNLTIRGCGASSTIITKGSGTDHVFHIVDSSHLRIESLAIVQREGGGLLVEAQGQDVRDVTLVALSVTTMGGGSGIDIRSGTMHRVSEVVVRECHVSMGSAAGPWPGVFVVGDDVDICSNVIEVSSLGTSVSAARGGLQIGATSDGVRVADNLIRGGIGNGITLGSLEEVDQQGEVIDRVVPWAVELDHMDTPATVYIPPTVSQGKGSYQSPGFLSDIRILANRIQDMGLNGIGVVGFFNMEETNELVTIVDLKVVDNHIRGCLTRNLASMDVQLSDTIGYGGIALADVDGLLIRNNLIEDNGVGHPEEITGIFVLHGEGIEIATNRIVHNGTPVTVPQSSGTVGQYGGISIVYGVAPMMAISTILENAAPRQNGLPALVVRDNSVTVPIGRALSATALGPVSVRGNQFTSRGVLPPGSPGQPPSFIASTVSIVNLGLSNEIYGQVLFSALRRGLLRMGEVGMRLMDDMVHMAAPGRHLAGQGEVGRYLANGNVLFSDNQCTLDLLESGESLSMSSIYIVSLDDIAFHDNECDCTVLDDFVVSQVILLGFSLRASDNRFKEGLGNAIFSAITIGAMNTTTNNQATHCLLVLPPAAVYPYTKDRLNTTLMCIPENAVARLLELVTLPFMEMTKLVFGVRE